jgi:hypothetical protein
VRCAAVGNAAKMLAARSAAFQYTIQHSTPLKQKLMSTCHSYVSHRREVSLIMTAAIVPACMKIGAPNAHVSGSGR